MKNSWIFAFGLMLLLEGAIPLLLPKQWREAFQRITEFSDGQIRFVGLLVLLCGVVTLGLVQLFS